MDEFDKALFYIFVLSFVLIVLAYNVGAKNVGGTLFGGFGDLILKATGRKSNGDFAGYPH